MISEDDNSKYPDGDWGWHREKSQDVVAFLAFLCAELNKIEGLSQQEKEGIYSNLSAALWNATKVMAYAWAAKWSTEDTGLIMQGGIDGYEEVLVRYGLMEKTNQQIRLEKLQLKYESDKQNIDDVIRLLEALILKGREHNRTELHKVLLITRLKQQPICDLTDALEDLTNNDISDEVFCDRAKPILASMREIRADYGEQLSNGEA